MGNSITNSNELLNKQCGKFELKNKENTKAESNALPKKTFAFSNKKKNNFEILYKMILKK